MAFALDFRGRLHKINAPLSTSIHAVFEAVANSFDATADDRGSGKITVRILRQPHPLSASGSELLGFEIQDNGVGFGDVQMTHFKLSDTTYKPNGKGIGRLLWLKVFDRAEIESCYKQNDHTHKRRFTFSEALNGINESDIEPTVVDGVAEAGTSVRLLSPKEDRIPALSCSAEELARSILEHFLLNFAVIRGQSLTVVDEHARQQIDVGKLYSEMIGSERHAQETFEIAANPFTLHHILVKPLTSRRNLVKLCANERVVTSEPLSAVVPELGHDAVTPDSLRYHAYVTGSYLNAISDDERTGLKFPQEPIEADDEQVGDAVEKPRLFPGAVEGIQKRELFNHLAGHIRTYLKDHVAQVRQIKEDKLEKFAAKEQPQFRPFVDLAKQRVDRLPARPTKRNLEIALYEAKIDGRSELEKLVEEITADRPAIAQVGEYQKTLVARFVTEATRHNQSALAEYVCTRKAVIEVLKANLQKGSDDANRLESAVHDLFFPMRLSSDLLPVGPADAGNPHIENLWLIDERLVFHRLLASDQPLQKIRGFLLDHATDKRLEPDIIIFDPAFVTHEGDDLQSIAIIEFKRPGRTDYSEQENPIKQILDITKKVRSGTFEDYHGEIKNISTDVRAFGFAICDVTPRLKEIVNTTYDMKKTPDGVGYYLHHANLNLVVELIPYTKLVTEAERRNKAFFQKLGIP
jgi:hypothetical protein